MTRGKETSLAYVGQARGLDSYSLYFVFIIYTVTFSSRVSGVLLIGTSSQKKTNKMRSDRVLSFYCCVKIFPKPSGLKQQSLCRTVRGAGTEAELSLMILLAVQCQWWPLSWQVGRAGGFVSLASGPLGSSWPWLLLSPEWSRPAFPA